MDAKTEKRRDFIINTIYVALVVALIVLVAKYLVPWLLPFIIGYVIALAFKPLVVLIVKHTKASPRFTGCVVLLFAYAVVASLLILGGSKLVGLIGGFLTDLPRLYTETLQPAIISVSDFFSDTLSPFLPEAAENSQQALNLTLQNLQSTLLSFSATAITGLGGITAKIPSFILAFFFSIMSSLIISMNYGQVTGFIARQIPPRHRELIMVIKNDTLHTVGNYLVAYFKLMCVTFAELSVGLTFLGVKNSVPIALGIAVFDILPVFGTGGILIPWVVISLINMRFALAAGLAILYAIILVVRNIIEPRIVGSQLGLHPLVTLCVIYAGFKLIGVGGMILFPIVAQIVVGLHRSGVIKLWNDT